MTATDTAVVRDRHLTIDGRRIYVREWGSADAPPLVLLHGIIGNSHEWSTVAAHLAGRRRVLVPDQRGHGASDWAASYTWDELADDIGRLADALELDEFDLAGHSMGGAAAMIHTGRGDRRVRRLAFIDVGPELGRQTEAGAWLQAYLAAAGQASFADPGELVAQWREGSPAARPTETRRWAEHSLHRRGDGRWAWRIDHRRIGALLQAMPEPEQLWAALRRIAVPVLVIRGDQSLVTSRTVAQRMVATLARGELVEVPGGHDLGVENPDPVARALAAFLDR